MYYFKAHYTNVYTFKGTTKNIQFDGQFFENEKECYLYAMSRAYDLACSDEVLDAVHFIAC